MEEGETESKTDVFDNRETDINDKYSASKHHISFCLPCLTLLISLLPSLWPSVWGEGVWGNKEERKEFHFWSSSTKQLSETLKRQNKRYPNRIRKQLDQQHVSARLPTFINLTVSSPVGKHLHSTERSMIEFSGRGLKWRMSHQNEPWQNQLHKSSNQSY